MKKSLFGAIVLLTILFTLPSGAGLQGLGFLAPQVDGASNVHLPQAGEIIFDVDSNSSGFKGYDGSSWLSLSEPTVVQPAKYRWGTAQSIPNDSYTVVNFDTPAFDDDSLVTDGTNWVYTAPRDGYYRVTTFHYFSTRTWSAGNQLRVDAYVNGTGVDTVAFWSAISGASITTSINGSTVLKLEENDTLDLRIYQNSGGSLTLGGGNTNYVIIEKIGE